MEDPEVVILDGSQVNLLISQAQIGFHFLKIIKGYDLIVFNVRHSTGKRGAFQIQIRSLRDIELCSNIFDELRNYVSSLNYQNVYNFEVVVSFTAKHSKYPNLNLVINLETIHNPNYGSIRIIDGYSGEKSMREEFIRETRVESLINKHGESQISSVYRFKEYGEVKIEEIFRDIERVLKLIR
ncbi:hypothetical protein ACNF40_05395 [Cuniculiplasma sp. SKW4]|uniref:hypothetical protein n=1 Tax=Cuniculiplasma sp. SKW4 TaxID=3400171 RepID=UPI003FD6A0A5